MKRWPARPILSLLLFGATLPLVAHSQERPAEVADTIRALEEQARKAVLDEDTAALERLWSEQFLVNNPQSQVLASRRDVLERVKRGLIRYSKFERRIEAIRQYGEVVIVMGAEEVVPIGKAPRAGQTVRRRFTNVWQKEAGAWRMIARHANVLPSE